MIKKLLLFATGIMLILSCAKNDKYVTADDLVKSALKEVNLITPDQLYSLMQGEEFYTLIDVRQENEFYPGYIPGSINIPRGLLEFQIEDEEFWDEVGLYQPEKTEKIVLVCKKGQRSVLTAESLKKLGYTNVFVLDSGYKKWELTYPDIYEKDLSKLSGNMDDKPKKSGSC